MSFPQSGSGSSCTEWVRWRRGRRLAVAQSLIIRVARLHQRLGIPDLSVEPDVVGGSGSVDMPIVAAEAAEESQRSAVTTEIQQAIEGVLDAADIPVIRAEDCLHEG